MWRVPSWEPVGRLLSYDQPTRAAVFSPDEAWLVTGAFRRYSLTADKVGLGRGSGLRLFSTETLESLYSIEPETPTGGYSTACFDGSSEYLIVASLAGLLTWLPVDPLREARRLKPRELSSIERRRFGVRVSS